MNYIIELEMRNGNTKILNDEDTSGKTIDQLRTEIADALFIGSNIVHIMTTTDNCSTCTIIRPSDILSVSIKYSHNIIQTENEKLIEKNIICDSVLPNKSESRTSAEKKD